MRSGKRDQMLAVATDLFNRCGYHAVGVDQIMAASGIAKTTLYRHFGSKDELIAAVLRRLDTDFRKNLRRFVETHADAPRERILATFDFLTEWFGSADFRGCPFVAAAGEFGEENHPVFQEVRLHKRLVLAYFEELARAAGFPEPETLAERVHLLHEGATAIAHIDRDPEVAARARLAAIDLLDAAA